MTNGDQTMDREALIYKIKDILETEARIDIHFEIYNLDEVVESIMRVIEAKKESPDV